MHILIAPNAFKNSLPAGDVSEALAEGLQGSQLDCSVELFPVADGGDGTAELIIERFQGQKVPVEVHDPLGRKLTAFFGLIDDGKTAVIEMADSSGLRLLSPAELDPMKASSYGTGEMIKAALDRGVKTILIGLGGSATVDGGAGILHALGVRFTDSSGRDLLPTPESLQHLDHIDVSQLDQRVFQCEITVLCDVDNLLLGENGCVRVFGPQKGASASNLSALESVLDKLAGQAFTILNKDMRQMKYGGAAGGTAAGLAAFLNARLVNGAEHFLRITHFDEALQRASLVITGEGSLDEQTLKGKAPYAVALHAKAYNIPIVGVAGRVPITVQLELDRYFNVLLAIGHEPSDLAEAMQNTRANLVRTGRVIGGILEVGGLRSEGTDYWLSFLGTKHFMIKMPIFVPCHLPNLYATRIRSLPWPLPPV